MAQPQVIRGDPLKAFLLSTVFKKSSEKTRSCDETKIEDIANRTPFSMKYKFCHYLRSRKEKRIFAKGLDRAFKELEVDHFVRM